MELRVVYTKYEPSFISRAIMWFSRKREHPERDCSHVLLKFQGAGGVLLDSWMAFEAMERGVWLNFYEKALGKQTIVAEFKLEVSEALAFEVARDMIEEFCGEGYDYAGIAIWASWILANRWFGSIVKWLHLKFRPKKVKTRFCSGLILSAINKVRKADPQIDWGYDDMEPRTSQPRNMIDTMFSRKALYKFIRGVAGGE